MKNTFKLASVALVLVSANAFAHHPAEDMVDPDVYAMIEENISDMHLALDFDDMGSTTDMGGSMSGRDDTVGSGVDLAEVGAAVEAGEAMAALADVAPAGAMNGQR